MATLTAEVAPVLERGGQSPGRLPLMGTGSVRGDTASTPDIGRTVRSASRIQAGGLLVGLAQVRQLSV